MDSKKRTQILLEDPNSMFKASKRIYLQELQGATLKTTKPFPEDQDKEFKGFELMASLISNLYLFQQITDVFYEDAYNRPIASQALDYSATRDAIKIKSTILSLIKQMSKLDVSMFNDDDIFTLLSLHDSIKTDYQELEEFYRNFNIPLQFGRLLGDIRKVTDTLFEFIKLINVRGIVLRPTPIEYQPNEEEFADAVEPPMEGAGRFKVLSQRIRKQQQSPFKRFL